MRNLFLRLVREHPQHERAHQGLMHIGDYYYNDHHFLKASRLYEQVVERFPETAEAVQARQLLPIWPTRKPTRSTARAWHCMTRRVCAGHRGVGGGDWSLPRHP